MRYFVENLLQARLSPRVGHKLPLGKAIPFTLIEGAKGVGAALNVGGGDEGEAKIHHSSKKQRRFFWKSAGKRLSLCAIFGIINGK